MILLSLGCSIGLCVRNALFLWACMVDDVVSLPSRSREFSKCVCLLNCEIHVRVILPVMMIEMFDFLFCVFGVEYCGNASP